MARTTSRFAAISGISMLAFVACSSPTDPGKPPVTIDPADLLEPPISCALSCGEIAGCEPKGYQCPALAAWDTIPHAAACGTWNGTFPAITGKCSASVPTGEAAKATGADPTDATATILPTGQRAKAAGKVSTFTDYKGQFPTNVIAVPGSDLVVVVDGGIGEQSVRLVDTTKIGGTGDPVVGRQKFDGSSGVNYGAAVVPGTPTRLWVSGSAGSVVFAFTLDVAAKTLARDAASDITIVNPPDRPKGGGKGGGYLLSGLAASPDGKRLVVGTGNAGSSATPIFVLDVDPASSTFKTVLKTIDLRGAEIFSITFHPADTAGRYAYVSVWDGARVDVVDLTGGTVLKSIPVGKNPQGLAPLDTRYLAVVASDGDQVSIIDTLSVPPANVLDVPLLGTSKLHGWSPTAVAFDGKRLYVTLAGINAVTALDFVAPASGPPTLVPAGFLGTQWWPTALTTRADGSLVVINGKGVGTGADPIAFGPGEGDITTRMRGSIQLIPAPDAAALTAGTAAVEAATNVGALSGASKVDCGGAPYDFPVPATNKEGPSKRIEHIVFIIKENKTFDAVFGDVPGVAGDPKLVMAPGQMDAIFGNYRKIGKTFANFDNYYTSAEQSLQGHIWTAFGRTTDFVERTWLVTWGRAQRPPSAGISPIGHPVEGSIFHWLQREGVPFDDMGELVGGAPDDGKLPRNCCLDGSYPGRVYAADEPDTRKSCYITARARATCDLKTFTYAVQPNDHTSGGAAGMPTPQTYIAVGDEGLGLLIDGLSHSPAWGSTLVVVTEDDPQDGGDHVDNHRTPLVMISPWVKRGYVSKGHYDNSSLYKLFAHLLGKSYPNDGVALASLPLDAFTSTPDYTPYVYLPRTFPLACNAPGTKMATEAAMYGWDLSGPDEAPGLQRQAYEIMRGPTAPRIALPDDD